MRRKIMRCPACKNEMTELQAGSVTVDICKGGCGGTWFDADELSKFDENSEFSPDTLLRVEKNSQVVIDRSKVRQCPRCVSTPLVQHNYDSQNLIEIDECLKCGGVWLDLSELKQIREQQKTEAERNGIVSAYNERLANSGKDTALSRRVAAVFGLLFK